MQSSTRLNIAQADFHLLWGGQAEVVFSLSKSLSERGHNITVICPPDSELSRRAAEAGLDVFTGCRFKKGLRPLSFLRDVSRLSAFLREKGIQIYHCHGSQDHWIGSLSAPHETRIVRTRHNIYPVKNHVANRWIFRKKTAQVITIFGDQGRFFSDTGLLAREKLVTIHSPLPAEFVNPAQVARVVRQELKLDDNVLLVGFVANSFHPDKAPLDFVNAAANVAKALPGVQFCMVGHGPLENDIRARIKALSLDGRFHLIGFRRDVVNVMASFDLLALTSVTREASSTVLKQASALGVPVIGTDVGGTREIIDHGKTGLLLKAGDIAAISSGMITLLQDRTRAGAMGAAGKEKVLREFTAHAIAERTEAVYHRLLGMTGDIGGNTKVGKSEPVLAQ